MAMRFYKINGQYQSWDYLHDDLGYTQEPSTTTSYKSSASATWGQSIVDSGYNIATDSTDLDTYQFWIENVSGWFSASEMAQEGNYPSFATDGPRFVKDGELSVSVEISGTGWRDTWYLLKKDVSIGWCTIRDLGEHGWEVDQGEIVGGLISDTYDKRIYSFGNGGLLVPGGYAYPDGALLDMQWDFGGTVEEDVQGLPIVQTLNGIIGTLSQQGPQDSTGIGDSVYHYNCDNGAYQLTTVNSGSAIAVVTISDYLGDNTNHGVGWVAERTSNGNVKITNNTSAAFGNTFGACIAYCDGSGVSVVTVYRLSDGTPFNAFKFQLDGVDYYYVLDDDTQIDLILALRYDPSTSQWLSKTFSSDDWWWSGVISQQEADDITNIGIGIITKSDTTSIWNGPYGSLNYNSEFDYELKNFYSDMGVTSVTFNKSNFFLEPNEYSPQTNYGGGMVIHSIDAYNTSAMTYKIRSMKGGNRSQIMYLAQDRSAVTIYNQEWHQLYRRDGVEIKYVGIIPVIFGYYSTANSDSLTVAAIQYIELRNNNGLLEARVYGMTSLSLSRIAVRWPDSVILAYKQDGTTATCYKCFDKYMVPSFDSDWRTENQLNGAGWYVKWRKYSIISSDLGYLNIRPGYGTDNTPIATFEYGETIWANPYLTGPSGYTSWLNIIISTDGGATTQSAWFDSSNAKLTYTESETDTNICLL